jgi:adenosylhomocysteine nucleosidase
MIGRITLTVAALLAPVAVQAKKLDDTPRTVVMTAFYPEWEALVPSVRKPRTFKVNGLTLMIGTLAGKPVVLMESGVSMVNAAMNTQLVLDRFRVRRIVFSGIAGGVDPALDIGDVVVPADWAQYLEAAFARQTPEGWATPEKRDPEGPLNWNMIFPRGVRVGNAAEPPTRHYRFTVDPQLLAIAGKVARQVTLRRCVAAASGRAATAVAADGPPKGACLDAQPRIVVGGTGVSAGVFADNAEFREYLQKAWGARVLDMESAAVVQVAYANSVPVIAFRSLSDLAGGDAGPNRMNTFMALASANSADTVRAFIAALPN